jgi:hypothetical protein
MLSSVDCALVHREGRQEGPVDSCLGCHPLQRLLADHLEEPAWNYTVYRW